MQYCSKL